MVSRRSGINFERTLHDVTLSVHYRLVTILHTVQANVKNFNVRRDFLFPTSHITERILGITTSEAYLQYKITYSLNINVSLASVYHDFFMYLI